MAWELAQLNIAEWAVDPDGPVAAEFHAQLAEVNGRGDAAVGWVWRLADASGDATAVPTPWGAGWIVNLTVWESAEALRRFTFRDMRHAEVMRDRRRWFVRHSTPTTVLWWVPAGHRPSLEEARARLEQLRRDGPSATAFGFRSTFPAPA